MLPRKTDTQFITQTGKDQHGKEHPEQPGITWKEIKMKYKRGVPKGYKHKWKYSTGPWNERKVGPGKWVFSWTATKGRRVRAKYHPGAPPRGSKVTWRINAIQTAYKTDANHYITRMKGTKRLVKMYRPRKKY